MSNNYLEHQETSDHNSSNKIEEHWQPATFFRKNVVLKWSWMLCNLGISRYDRNESRGEIDQNYIHDTRQRQ